MTTEEMEALLAQAFRQLWKAVEQMKEPTTPWTALPRPKVIRLVPGVYWPYVDSEVEWHCLRVQASAVHLIAFVPPFSNNLRLDEPGREYIEEWTRGWQPRLVLHLLRQLRRATRWCEERAEGRGRAARNILAAQERTRRELEAEITLLKLS